MEQGKLVYIAIPPELAKTFTGAIDPSIPLPVELPSGQAVFNPEMFSAETVLSGLLRALASEDGGGYADYYRSLALALRPDILTELTGAAVLKSKNGAHETALEILALLEGLYPRSPVLLLRRAQILEARAAPGGAETAAAEAAWEEALAIPLPDTLFYAGLFYYGQGEYRRAAELFGIYLDAETAGIHDGRSAGADSEADDSRNADGVTASGGLFTLPDAARLAAAEKRETARKLFAEIREDGLDDEVFREAYSLIRGGEEENGILRVKEFLENRPRAARGWFVLGWGLRRLSRWEDAASCFEKALELGLAGADTRNELAICLMETGGADRARRELETALREEPENVKIISNLGVLALKQGRKGEAAAFFRAALELDPHDPVAAQLAARIAPEFRGGDNAV